MKFLTRLRTLISPRPVSSILTDANALVAELNHTATVQQNRSDHFWKMSLDASKEAQHAKRVAGKISELVS